jgi:hypothetical protein
MYYTVQYTSTKYNQIWPEYSKFDRFAPTNYKFIFMGKLFFVTNLYGLLIYKPVLESADENVYYSNEEHHIGF